jgi:hypothetical protein
MPLCRNGLRLCGFVAVCGFTSMTSCSGPVESRFAQSDDPPPIDGKNARDASADDGDAAIDAGERDAETRISTREEARDAGADGGDEREPEPTKKPEKKKPEEAKEPEAPKKDEGKEGEAPDAPREEASKPTEEPKQEAESECSRKRLREKAEAYLQSMASGDTTTLRMHPSLRYTENGQVQQVGAGAWLRRAETVFSRHVLDETSCSSLTQAVMNGLTGRFSFGVRLRYDDAELLEAEAQFVPEVLAATDLDAVIPMGDDAFVAEVPQEQRASRDELFDIGRRYFDSVIDAASLPPSAPECRRLQNGLPLGNGTCTEPPGSARFQQQRFDLADEPNGIVTATVVYENHIGFYLLKVSDDRLQRIEVIGGATSAATGW